MRYVGLILIGWVGISIVVTPLVVALCKSAKHGDKLNALVEVENEPRL